MNAFFTDSILWSSIPTNKEFKGKDGYREYIEGWIRALPDATVEVLNLIESHNVVVVEGLGRALQTGQENQTRVEFKFCDVFHFENDRVVKGRTYFDMLSLLRQLGFRDKGARAA